MATLQQAKTMALVSREANQKLLNNALESIEFKELVRKIEEAAEQGVTDITYRNVDYKILSFFKEHLESNGYDVRYSLPPYDTTGITVNWDLDISDINSSEESEA